MAIHGMRLTCQLLLLALHSYITRKIVAVLEHEILTLAEPLRGQPKFAFGSTTAIGNSVLLMDGFGQ